MAPYQDNFDDEEPLTSRASSEGRRRRQVASTWLLGRSWCSKLLGVWVMALIAMGWTVGYLYPGFVGDHHQTGTKGSSKPTPNSGRNKNNGKVSPPVARREEDRVFYAGVAPDGWDPSIPRQAETSQEPLLDPPLAIDDPYGWLRDDTRSDPEVLDHIHAENNYTEYMTKHLKQLRKKIYDELLSYVDETDASLPIADRDYYYYRRVVKDQPYPLHCRAPVKENDHLAETLEAWDALPQSPLLKGEKVYLDENVVCEEKASCGIRSLSISPSQKRLAYTADFVGNEVYHLVVHDLETDTVIFEDDDMRISSTVEWGADDDTVFYLGIDDAQRPNRLYRKTLSASTDGNSGNSDSGTGNGAGNNTGTSAGAAAEAESGKSENNDDLILEENDVLFWMGHWKSLDDKYLMVAVDSTETSEVHYLDLTTAGAKLECISPRNEGVIYSAAHRNGYWWILSNKDGTPNLQVYTAPLSDPEKDGGNDKVGDQYGNWELAKHPDKNGPITDGSAEIAINSLEVSELFVVLSGREGGIPRIWVLRVTKTMNVASLGRLEFDEAAHDVSLAANWEYKAKFIIIGYQSLVSPHQYIKVSLKQPQADREVIKQKMVEGYIQDNYESVRITVPSRDGHTEIPISLVYRKDVMDQARDHGKQVHFHLYAYGTYGVSIEDSFSPSRLPLLDRGIVYVVVHVRGGGEMGRQWYEEPDGGKYLCKKNTFNDFIDVAKWLVEVKKWTKPELLSCEGRSAGGMTIGASINQAPDLFRMAILGVPFVDLMATMVDASIPLTAGEWEEWGNPNEKKYFEYMMSYSPMNNVQKNAKYPSILLLGGLHDPRVAFWEPTKMAQTLRHEQGKHSGPVCLKVEMSAGHFSQSDRYKYLESKAFDFAFLLNEVGLAQV